MSLHKLAIGCVQFGLPYGVTNTAGQVPPETVLTILDAARRAGADTLDTAIAYGDSEAVLGACGMASWRVVTKLPALPDHELDVGAWVRQQVRASLARLGVLQLHGVLLHRASQLLEARGSALLDALVQLQQDGLTLKIGVSVYDPDELGALMACHHFDLVQAPCSILDRRLLDSGWAARLRADGVEVHTRSAFLQGLLLSPALQQTRFAAWQDCWLHWQAWLDHQGLTALQACARFALHQDTVDKAVLGFESVTQLDEVCTQAGQPLANLPDWPAFDPRLLNPATWTIS